MYYHRTFIIKVLQGYEMSTFRQDWLVAFTELDELTPSSFKEQPAWRNNTECYFKTLNLHAVLSKRTKTGQVNGIRISKFVGGLKFKGYLLGRVLEIGYPSMASGKIELYLPQTTEDGWGFLNDYNTVEELCIGIEYIKNQCLKFGR